MYARTFVYIIFGKMIGSDDLFRCLLSKFSFVNAFFNFSINLIKLIYFKKKYLKSFPTRIHHKTKAPEQK